MRWIWLWAALLLGTASPATAQPRDDDAYAALVAGYAGFQDDARWLADADAASSEGLDEALDRAARHNPAFIAQGWVVYGALNASAAPDFVRGVQARVRAASRAAVLRRLMVDDGYARRRPNGADQAIGYILRGAAQQRAQLTQGADRFNALGDTLRGQAWASAPETDRAAREARLRALVAPASATPLYHLDLATSALPNAAPRADRQHLIDQMLTLAALKILNATQANAARTQAITRDEVGARCLTLAQLELRQCVSVTQFAYENAYCLARHGLSGPAACFALSR